MFFNSCPNLGPGAVDELQLQLSLDWVAFRELKLLYWGTHIMVTINPKPYISCIPHILIMITATQVKRRPGGFHEPHSCLIIIITTSISITITNFPVLIATTITILINTTIITTIVFTGIILITIILACIIAYFYY